MKLISEEKFVVHHCISAAASRRTLFTRTHKRSTRKITPNGSFGSQEQTGTSCRVSGAASKPVEKCKKLPLRARRHCFSAQKKPRSHCESRSAAVAAPAIARLAAERCVQLACRQTNEQATRKKLRIATHPHNQLDESEDTPFAVYAAFGASWPFCTGKKSLNSGGNSSSE